MRMAGRLILVVVILFLKTPLTNCYGQTSVAESNKANGEVWLGGQADPFGVKGVKIKLLDKRGKTTCETTTDANGNFTITISDSVDHKQKFVLLLHRDKTEGINKHYYSKINKRVSLDRFPTKTLRVVAGKYKRTSGYYFTKRYLKKHWLTGWIYPD